MSLTYQNNTLCIAGVLDKFSTPALLKQIPKLQQNTQVDLSHIDRADSAGCAFLLELQRTAKKNNIGITFNTPPKQLQQLIDFYKLNEILNFKTAL